MKDKVYLDVTYEFEEGEAWTNVYDFERDQAKFLTSIGLEGKISKPLRGSPGRLVIYISPIKKDLLLDPAQNWKNQKKGKP